MDAEDFDAGIVFEVLSQTGNKDVHAAAVEVVVLTPDLFESQSLAAKSD